MNFNKAYEQRVYAVGLEQSELNACESHKEWVRRNLEQEKNLMVFGCIDTGASWANCSPSAAELEAAELEDVRQMRYREFRIRSAEV